ncbi:phage tail assembly chaperone [Pseudomonas frederiksbergensis]|uniref:phage tail assembly chaperone n=1 Tax=Pseudomonas frederiksbergensis TaxID=104087 RepID=UPI000F49D94D|nr:phage tail assembly chaperone [Pseudomonas frederiksbergensis]RON56959.1 phage tail protein [Pseudomonas frederiksbergensis]
MIYSSKTTGFFHDSDLGGELPADAFEISPELHAELLNGQSQLIKINFDTVPPSLIERPPMPPEQLADFERAWRDGQLAKTDGIVARQRDELEDGGATTLTAEQYAELQVYRRKLRDWPQEAEFPLVDHRPVAPAWLSGQLQ